MSMTNVPSPVLGAEQQIPAEGSAFPEVLAEVEKLQSRKSSLLGGAVILVLSLAMFVVIGTGGKSGWTAGPQARQMLLILVPVLFFHELGHYVAMRVFGYRNVRMFFIPMFGAAVKGTNYSAPGWKKVVVALMGPLPGIFLGAVLGSMGIVLHNPLLIKIALVSLILNGSNLIPVLPLDGGRVVQTLLFSRHYAADAIFRVIAAGLLIWAGIKLPEHLLLYLGIVMFLGIPLIVRRGQIAAELRRAGLVPTPTDDQRIPTAVADAIITRLKSGAQKIKLNNKNLAQSTLAIYEALCNRPPGWLATIGFGVVHVSAIVLATVLAIALYAEQRGGLANLIRSAASAPKRTISSSDIETVGDHVPSNSRRTIIANFATTAEAKSAFSTLFPGVRAGEAIERFGQTILIAFSANDNEARRRYLADIEKRTKTFAVTGEHFEGGAFRFTCWAPDEASAVAIRDEVQGYLQMPSALHLIPPWSPMAADPAVDWSRCKLARSTYLQLTRAGQGGYADPDQKAVTVAMQEAMRRGDSDEYKRLSKELAGLIAKRQKADLERIKRNSDGSVDPVIVEKYFSLPSISAAAKLEEDDRPDDFNSPPYHEMAQRMGQLPLANGKPTASSLRFSTQYGMFQTEGSKLQLDYCNFEDPIEGAHALVDWLSARGCRTMRYDFQIGAAPAGLSD